MSNKFYERDEKFNLRETVGSIDWWVVLVSNNGDEFVLAGVSLWGVDLGSGGD